MTRPAEVPTGGMGVYMPVTGPEQVLVNVADLEVVVGTAQHSLKEWVDAKQRLIAALTEPEWEPTDDMVAKGRRALGGGFSDEVVDEILRALRGEGLL